MDRRATHANWLITVTEWSLSRFGGKTSEHAAQKDNGSGGKRFAIGDLKDRLFGFRTGQRDPTVKCLNMRRPRSQLQTRHPVSAAARPISERLEARFTL